MTRAERAAEAARLHAEGLNGVQIAGRMGISRSYTYGLLNDPSGDGDRVRKRSYGGSCVDCGAPTSGSEGRRDEPRCKPCADILRGERCRIWTPALIVARIREWADTYGEPPASPDWSPARARVLNDCARATRYENANGYWPAAETALRAFGSWNAAIAAAGFTPRPAHGVPGRHRSQRERAAA